MTFERLQEILGSPQNFNDWRQQSNGHGWVHKTATCSSVGRIEGLVYGNADVNTAAEVLDEAQVYEKAILSGKVKATQQAKIHGNSLCFDRVVVSGESRISGHALLFDKAEVSGKVTISGEVVIKGTSKVTGDVCLNGKLELVGNAKIEGGIWETSPLHIVGTRWSLTNSKPGYLRIGCELRPFAWWQENKERLAKVYKLTETERTEYFSYIDLFSKIGV